MLVYRGTYNTTQGVVSVKMILARRENHKFHTFKELERVAKGMLELNEFEEPRLISHHVVDANSKRIMAIYPSVYRGLYLSPKQKADLRILRELKKIGESKPIEIEEAC